jgi:transcription elongation GreA/GreB family factor
MVTLEADDGSVRLVFLGPDAGGLKLFERGVECVVITPESPLGRALLGKVCGDEVQTGSGKARKTFIIVAAA